MKTGILILLLGTCFAPGLPPAVKADSVCAMSKTYAVAMSPSQRFSLFSAMTAAKDRADKVRVLSSAESKEFRRAFRAFGLRPIYEAIRKHQNTLSAAQLNSDELAVFDLSDESIGYFVAKVMPDMERTPVVDLIVGDLLDVFEEVASKRDSGYRPAVSPETPLYSAERENWAPPPQIDATTDMVKCPGCGHVFVAEEAPAKSEGAPPLGEPSPLA
jgi:hypothetical protein